MPILHFNPFLFRLLMTWLKHWSMNQILLIFYMKGVSSLPTVDLILISPNIINCISFDGSRIVGHSWSIHVILQLSNKAVYLGCKSTQFYPDSTYWPIVGIVNFKFKDYNSAVEDLSTCVKRDKKNSSAHTYLVSKCYLWSCIHELQILSSKIK